jgi:hypothetical protein
MIEDADDETKWIREPEALDWVMRTWGMPWGPAMALCRDIYASRKLRAFDQSGDMSNGTPKYIPQRLSDLTGGFVHDLRINFEELNFLVRQLLGDPATAAPFQAGPRVDGATMAADKAIDLLAEWIFAQHSRHLSHDELLKEACASSLQLGSIKKEDFRGAHKQVYETKRGRRPVGGWPLRTPYKERLTERK